jgi:hypothetical protein
VIEENEENLGYRNRGMLGIDKIEESRGLEARGKFWILDRMNEGSWEFVHRGCTDPDPVKMLPKLLRK